MGIMNREILFSWEDREHEDYNAEFVLSWDDQSGILYEAWHFSTSAGWIGTETGRPIWDADSWELPPWEFFVGQDVKDVLRSAVRLVWAEQYGS